MWTARQSDQREGRPGEHGEGEADDDGKATATGRSVLVRQGRAVPFTRERNQPPRNLLCHIFRQWVVAKELHHQGLIGVAKPIRHADALARGAKGLEDLVPRVFVGAPK